MIPSMTPESILTDIPGGRKLTKRSESQETVCTEQEETSCCSLSSECDEDPQLRSFSVAEGDEFEASNTSQMIGNSNLEMTLVQEDSQEEQKSRPSVRFSTLEIRTYPMVMGDNPSVTRGIPVTIDWDYDGEFVCDVNDYEEYKPARRTRMELQIPSSVRSSIVMQGGASRKEIQEQQKKVNIVKNQRKRTSETEKLQKLEEVLELTWRATMNATIRQNRKKMERKYIMNAAA
mmetsp:Transcript_1027/g.1609  ORF Transcript_1027/g.1609 Transcript_1027/m.1609 type:complete len:233 (-) Transcript_1027:240-938(-)